MVGAGVGVRKTIITRICGVVGSGNGKSLSLCPRSCSCVCACVRACALNEVNNFNEKQPTIHRSRRTYTEFTAAAVVQLQHVALDEGLARRLPGHRHRVVLRRTVIRYHAGRQRCCDGKCGICVWVLQFGFCGKSQCAKDGTETKQNKTTENRKGQRGQILLTCWYSFFTIFGSCIMCTVIMLEQTLFIAIIMLLIT